jgi:hypothetical protein
VRGGLGWGVFHSLPGPVLEHGLFVRVCETHLDVPLCWQCWKLDSPIVGRITDGVRSAAKVMLTSAKYFCWSAVKRRRLTNICWAVAGTGVTVVLWPCSATTMTCSPGCMPHPRWLCRAWAPVAP